MSKFEMLMIYKQFKYNDSLQCIFFIVDFNKSKLIVLNKFLYVLFIFK